MFKNKYSEKFSKLLTSLYDNIIIEYIIIMRIREGIGRNRKPWESRRSHQPQIENTASDIVIYVLLSITVIFHIK